MWILIPCINQCILQSGQYIFSHISRLNYVSNSHYMTSPSHSVTVDNIYEYFIPLLSFRNEIDYSHSTFILVIKNVFGSERTYIYIIV